MGSEERLLTFAQPFAEFALLSQYEEYSPVKGPFSLLEAFFLSSLDGLCFLVPFWRFYL